MPGVPVTINVSPFLPDGATVAAYPGALNPVGTPPGGALESSVAAVGGNVTFSTLAADRHYYAVGQTATGAWEWIAFSIPPPVASGGGGGTGGVTNVFNVTTGGSGINWQPNTAYGAGNLVEYNGALYRSTFAFTSTATFNPVNWRPLTVGAADQSYTNPYIGNLGVSTHFRTLSAADMVTACKQVASYGFTWIREDCLWNAIEYAEGSFNWTYMDNLMTAVSSAGLSLLPVIHTTPNWAHGGDSDILKPPTDPQKYANFAVAMYARYGVSFVTTGSFWQANPALRLAPIVYCELWNEPFSNVFWHGPGTYASPFNSANLPDPAGYASICFKAGTSLRASGWIALIGICGEPYGNVPGFTTTSTAGQWLHQVLTSETRLLSNSLFDFYTVHPYTGPSFYSPWDAEQGSGSTALLTQGRFDKVLEAKRQATVNGAGAKPIWITEFGWGGTGGNGVGEDLWAEYLQGGIRRLFREFNVQKAFIYTLETLRVTPSPSNQPGSILRFNGANQPGAPSKPLQRVTELLTVGDNLQSQHDEILLDRPVFYSRLANTSPACEDRSTSNIQGATVSATGNARAQPSLTTDPLGASTWFDGLSGAMTVPADSTLNITQGLTLSVWVKPDPSTSGGDIIRKYAAYRMSGNLSSGVLTVSFGINQGTDQVYTSSVANGLTLGTVYLIHCTYDGITQSIYVNGRLLGTPQARTGAIDTSTSPLGIGWRGTGGTGFFNGWLQEAVVYNYALSPRRIAEQYQAGVGVIAT